MKRPALAVTALALAACAAPPETAPPAPPQASAAPGGEWVVVEDYAAAPVGVLASPYKGQPVTLDAARAVDPAGRLCKAPQYWMSQSSAEIILNRPAQPQAGRDPALRPALSITCGGAPFLALVSQPDGSWLTRQGAWVLRLDRPAPAPAPAPAPVAMVPAVEPPALEPVKAAPAAPDQRVLVYLASYRTEAQAHKGFQVLAKASPILARRHPVTQAVDLGEKGKWVRLYGMAADDAERKTICGQLGKRVDECGARNRE